MRHVVPVILIASIHTGCIEYGVKGFGSVGGASIMTSAPDTQTDTWEAPGTDLIFFGDTSDSMAMELTTMGDHALTFMDRLDDYDNKWQIIAVTGWDGCGVNGIISPDVPEYDRLFADGLLTPPSADAVDAGADEWGLHNVDQAVQASTPGGCNEGFLREDALLHAIFLSDEPDTSPGWDSGDTHYWQTYMTNISTAKGGDHFVTFSAVVGPPPDGCTGALAGSGYIEAVEYTEGSILSICDDWYNELDSLVYASVQISDFPLSETPDVDTLQVVVDETVRESGWEYRSEGNLVHFTESLPTTGQTVAISYDIAAE